jgi:hypothetical protein
MQNAILAALLLVKYELNSDAGASRPFRTRRTAAIAEKVTGIGGIGHGQRKLTAEFAKC